MKQLKLLLLFCLFYSCTVDNLNETETKSVSNQKNEIIFKIGNINMGTVIYQRIFEKGGDSTTKFYYPAEIWTFFEIQNNFNDSLLLLGKDTLFPYHKYNVYVTCNYRNHIINLYTRNPRPSSYIKTGSSFFGSAYIIDLPIFDSILSKYEFSDFLTDFSSNSTFSAYLMDNEGKTYNFNFDSLNLQYNFYIDEFQIEKELIGYSDSIKIFNKSVFGPLIGSY